MDQQTYTREEFLLQEQYYKYSKRRVIIISVFLTLASVCLIATILKALEARLKKHRISNATDGQLYELQDRNLYVRQNGSLVKLVPESGVGVMGRGWSWWRSKRKNGGNDERRDSTRVNSVVLQEEGLSVLQPPEGSVNERPFAGIEPVAQDRGERDITDTERYARN